MSLSDFMTAVVTLLKEAKVDHMLTGSLAAAYHTVPRATQDIDILVEVTADQVEDLVTAFGGAGFYVDEDAALSALDSESQFNVIDPHSGWKADLIIRRDRPFSAEEFNRREAASLLGVDTWIATVEDLILAKMEWAAMGDSAIQRRDVRALVRAAGDSLDLAYMDRWLDDLGIRDEWDALVGEIDQNAE